MRDLTFPKSNNNNNKNIMGNNPTLLDFLMLISKLSIVSIF